MDAPTPADIRTASQVDFDELGYVIIPHDDPTPDEDKLALPLAYSLAWFEWRTGVVIADIDEEDTDADPPGTHVATLSLEAIRMLVEHRCFVGQPDLPETAADFNMIQNFAAGRYSENRRSSTFQRKIHPWPDLADLLMMLMTPEKRSLFNEVPVVGAVEPRWDVGIEIIDAQAQNFLTYFGVYSPPWDGGPLSP